ncbi:MAG: extensin family protein [Acidobacteriota bacterium]
MWRFAPMLLVLTGAADARPRADNMPRGWTWPPSRTMVTAAKACEARLDELGVTWKSGKRAGHIVDAIVVSDGTIGGITYTNVYDKGPLVMDCQLVLALAQFAPHLYELGVREVKVGSIFRWSKVRVGGHTKNLLSRHALGIAMDVVSFVDDTGREAVVAKDYKNDDDRLLGVARALADSGSFRLVLTPKNDPISHKDHFHVEANPDYSDPPTEKPAS